MISAAARKRRIAASPLVSEPLFSSAPATVVNSAPAESAAPAMPMPLRNERRLAMRCKATSAAED